MLWSPHLQLSYPFENQANDYSGNARHGTVNGSGVYATRPNAGRCLYFDGVGDYVATPSFGLSGTVVILTCWMRIKTNATSQFILSDNSPDTMVGFIQCYRQGGADKFQWRYATGTQYLLSTAVDYFKAPFEDTWLHAGVVCDYAGKKCYFFRNGTLFYADAAMSGTPVFPSTNRTKYIGANNTTPQYPIVDGYLQNVQLWTLAICPPVAQMTANANRLMLGMNPIWSV
jgi:hypothetical protein